MSSAPLPVRRRFLETMRPDAWWVAPVAVLIILSIFLIYANWASWQGNHYSYGPYLSPFYSPEIYGYSEHAWFGPPPSWWPAWFTPAMLILPFPGLFRVTCYYYRGAYYRAFWADPPACSVGEPRKKYIGESSFPLIVQNIHRYFLYVALGFLLVLLHDVWKALWFVNPATGQEEFGIGVGTLVLAANVTLLSGYTLGCHALRHVVGGFKDHLSGHPVRKRMYECVSCLNRGHMLWAWNSLLSVMFADFYVRLCSMGIWVDFRIL